jgi:uncharacterized protein YegJ (DUF2314 family)
MRNKRIRKKECKMRDKEKDLEFERAHTIDVDGNEYAARLEEMNKIIDKKMLQAAGHIIKAKVRFTNNEGDVEWMWVQITEMYSETREFVGRLINTPLVITHVDINDYIKGSYDKILELEILD